MGRAVLANSALFLWPPRSPDLTPLDFFFWGFVKCKVYKGPLPVDGLKDRIRPTLALVTVQILKKVFGDMTRRLKKTTQVKGRNFQVLKIKISHMILNTCEIKISV